MPATIRLAVPEDARCLPDIEKSAAQAFRAIEALSWISDAPAVSLERHSPGIASGTCWVAVDADNRPQGFLNAQRHDTDLHINELSVMHSMQGQGLGRQLIEAARQYARSNRLRFITLTTFTAVPWNAPFYAREGFRINTSQDLDKRLAAILSEEYKHGFAPGSRCAMSWQVI